jgi:hypothetical protein
MPTPRKKDREGDKKKRVRIDKARRKQLVAIFLVLLMVGSALVLMFTAN